MTNATNDDTGQTAASANGLTEDFIFPFETLDELRSLLDLHDEPAVSIYFPTVSAGPQTRQNRIRFKNALSDAEALMEREGITGTPVKETLRGARDLINDERFWSNQHEGFAAFLAPGTRRFFRLPVAPPETTVVADRFYIKPLVPLVVEDGWFYVLALSQKDVRLLRGTHYTVQRIEAEALPDSLAEALAFNMPEHQLQYHTRQAAGMGDRGAMYHGQGVGDDPKQKVLREYFLKIDHALNDVLLRRKRTPLVLAGVKYLQPIYREVSRYPVLLDDGIEGNPDALSEKELHDRAWPLVEPHFNAQRETATQRYHEAAAKNKGADKTAEVVAAACTSRVDTLFAAEDQPVWGTCDPAGGEAEVHGQRRPGDRDLVDVAVAETLKHDGTVFVEPQNAMPTDAPVAATFRF